MSVNETLFEDKMRRFKGECAPFSFNNCFIYTHDGVSTKFSTNSPEMGNSVCIVSSHKEHRWIDHIHCKVDGKIRQPDRM